MRIRSAVLLFTLLATASQAQKVVTPNSCAGKELRRDDVLLVDVSEAPDRDVAIADAIEKYHLKVVKKKVIETEMAASMAGAFRKAARVAAKERCDVVIVVAKGVGREQESVFMAGPNGFSGYSVPDADEWVAVIFAEIEVQTE